MADLFFNTEFTAWVISEVVKLLPFFFSANAHKACRQTQPAAKVTAYREADINTAPPIEPIPGINLRALAKPLMAK